MPQPPSSGKNDGSRTLCGWIGDQCPGRLRKNVPRGRSTPGGIGAIVSKALGGWVGLRDRRSLAKKRPNLAESPSFFTPILPLVRLTPKVAVHVAESLYRRCAVITGGT
jgi:hypothetical protein